MRFFFKGLRFQNWRSQIFQKKKSFGEKAQKFLQNIFLGFWWKFNLLTCLLYSKMIPSNAVYDSAKTAFLGKIWFSSPLVLCFSSTKCFQPIRMQVSLISNIRDVNWLEIIDILDFCTEIVIKERWNLILPFLIECDQLHLSFKQTAGLFDHQYLWKVLIFILVFFIWSYSSRESSIGDYCFRWDLTLIFEKIWNEKYKAKLDKTRTGPVFYCH